MKSLNQTALFMVLFAGALVYLSDTGKLASVIGIVKGPAPTAPTFSWTGFFGNLPFLGSGSGTPSLGSIISPLGGFLDELGISIPSVATVSQVGGVMSQDPGLGVPPGG
jgi:hypothetical protein